MRMRQENPRKAGTVLFLLVMVLVFGAGDARAQGAWGFYGGLNVANMGGDMDQLGDDLAAELAVETGQPWTATKGSRTAPGFGAFYYLPRSPTMGLQFEVQYVGRGTKFDLATSGLSAEIAIKANYLEVPILARLSPASSGSTRVFFVVGPVIGFKTGADLELTALGQSQSVDFSEGFKSTTFAAVGGVGIDAKVGAKTSLMIQARYHLGLANAIEDPIYSSKAGDFSAFAGLGFDIVK